MSIIADRKELAHHIGHKLAVNKLNSGGINDEYVMQVVCLTCDCVLYEEQDDYDNCD